MKKISKPIVFFGSGPVAAESLRMLAASFEVEAVITKPRPPHHKGETPVISIAESLGLPFYAVTNKVSLDALIDTHKFDSQLAVLIDFGIIVSQYAIDAFPMGIVNSHFSLLPEWRGADPITFSILSGQKETGISLMLLTAGMDEGPLLAQSTYILPDDITTPILTRDLIELSHNALVAILPLYMANEVAPAPQELVTMSPDTVPTYSRKITKEDGILDFTKSATELEREIRAFAEWPKSRTKFGNLDVIITKAHVVDQVGTPGTLSIIQKQPAIHTGEQTLAVDLIKPAGKKEMSGEAFLAGYKHLLQI
jgi:methionyl-tRNA formyltransferase